MTLPDDVLPLPVVVLLSGGGTNFQAILDAATAGKIPIRMRAAISDREDAFGLERARRGGVATEVHTAKGYPDRVTYDAALAEIVDRYEPGLVILAGFMRILSAPFVQRYWGRLLNIHPALLPAYRGLDTYRRVLDAGDPEHGTSVHFVTEELDGGPVIAQSVVKVRAGDDEASLSARVQQREYILYPTVIDWFARGRLRLEASTVILDGEPLPGPVVL